MGYKNFPNLDELARHCERQQVDSNLSLRRRLAEAERALAEIDAVCDRAGFGLTPEDTAVDRVRNLAHAHAFARDLPDLLRTRLAEAKAEISRLKGDNDDAAD